MKINSISIQPQTEGFVLVMHRQATTNDKYQPNLCDPFFQATISVACTDQAVLMKRIKQELEDAERGD